jgi:hypothetical protein
MDNKNKINNKNLKLFYNNLPKVIQNLIKKKVTYSLLYKYIQYTNLYYHDKIYYGNNCNNVENIISY